MKPTQNIPHRLTESILGLFVLYCVLRLVFKGQAPYIFEKSVIFPGLEIGVLFYFIVLMKMIAQLSGLEKIRKGFYGITSLLLVGFLLTLPLQGRGEGIYLVFFGLLMLTLPLITYFNDLKIGQVNPQFSLVRNLMISSQRGIVRFIEMIRGLWSLIGMICLYPWMTVILKSAPSPDVDEKLAAIDQFLFGGVNPMRWIERIHSDAMSDWMALCYTVYGLYVILVIGVLFLRKDQRAVKNAAFLMSVALAVGYMGYTLFPALGPMYTQKFSFDLHFKYFHQIKTQFMDEPRINRDCFPSLHTCLTFLLTWISWKEIRFLFWIFLPVSLTMPVSCVYLRYHYVTDVLAGAFLCLMIIGLDHALKKNLIRVFKFFPAVKEDLYS